MGGKVIRCHFHGEKIIAKNGSLSTLAISGLNLTQTSQYWFQSFFAESHTEEKQKKIRKTAVRSCMLNWIRRFRTSIRNRICSPGKGRRDKTARRSEKNDRVEWGSRKNVRVTRRRFAHACRKRRCSNRTVGRQPDKHCNSGSLHYKTLKTIYRSRTLLDNAVSTACSF